MADNNIQEGAFPDTLPDATPETDLDVTDKSNEVVSFQNEPQDNAQSEGNAQNEGDAQGDTQNEDITLPAFFSDNESLDALVAPTDAKAGSNVDSTPREETDPNDLTALGVNEKAEGQPNEQAEEGQVEMPVPETALFDEAHIDEINDAMREIENG